MWQNKRFYDECDLNRISIGFESDFNHLHFQRPRAIYIKDKDIDKDIDLHYDVVKSLCNIHIAT